MDSFVSQTERQLHNLERLNPELNAIITSMPESALKAAHAADRAHAEGRYLGLLHGMTIAVKDNIDIANLPTTAGAAFLRNNIAKTDAPVVKRLIRAGATIVGKANMAELAFGSRSFSAIGGQCRNPWDLRRIPGGSSGGSAVAVAADFCTGALGTDTGGSVRLPACYNGVAGLRPTHGRIPLTGVVPVSEHNDTVGPIARHVEDIARIFAAIVGYDDDDPHSIDVPVPNFLPTIHDGLRGKRIGIPKNFYFEKTAPDVAELVMNAARELEVEGAVLVDIELPLAAEAHAHASNIIYSDVCNVFYQQLTQHAETITASVVERMSTGLKVTGTEYAAAVAFQIRWRRQIKRLFQKVDILLSPTTPAGAPAIEDGASLLEATRASTRNTYAGSHAGIPGLSVPCGFDINGMPVGAQLEAAWCNEAVLFQAGITYQTRVDYHLRRAPLVAGVPAQCCSK